MNGFTCMKHPEQAASRSVVAGGALAGVTAMGFRVSLGDDGNVLKWILVMDAQLCDYTKNH